jgi:hypothetical protein
MSEKGKMKVLVFLVLLASVAEAGVLTKLLEWRGKLFGYPSWELSAAKPAKRDGEYKPPKATCGAYTREMAVDCIHYLADLNCDHSLDRHEVSKN